MRKLTSNYLRYSAMEFNNVITPGCSFLLILNKTFHLVIKSILKGSKIFQPVMKLIKFKEQATRWLQKFMKLTRFTSLFLSQVKVCVCVHVHSYMCTHVCMYEYSKEYWKILLEKQSTWKKPRPTNLKKREIQTTEQMLLSNMLCCLQVVQCVLGSMLSWAITLLGVTLVLKLSFSYLSFYKKLLTHIPIRNSNKTHCSSSYISLVSSHWFVISSPV